MKFTAVTAGLVGAASALSGSATLFENGEQQHDNHVERRIPTSYESAVMGRRILALTKLATMSTVFPDDHDAAASERRPSGLGGQPIGLMDYIADCEDEGNPTILAIRIGTTFKNVRAGSNITVSLQWTPPYPPAKRISFLSRLSAYIPFLGGGNREDCPYTRDLKDASLDVPDTAPYSAANLPRFSLLGYLEPIDADEDEAARLATCYTSKHRDARYWLPGNRIHTSEWVRMVVTKVYWIGGFGDRAYIGWIPTDEWKSVTEEEWRGISLPGEKKGWSEWSTDEAGEL
ncbi:hypothetical protein K4F52_002853 [Lecanicillium sp. MT-2017a]|nr:hypothetical protein K4F52_002853 [Lecanicillium sp. MT-2017a]